MSKFGYGFPRMMLICGALALALRGWNCGGPTGNAGGGMLHWTMTAPSEGWVTLSQREGNTADKAARIDVRINREKAPAGQQQVTLVVTGDGGARQEVVLVAMITRPELVVAPTELLFEASAQSKSLIVENGGTGTLTWSSPWDLPACSSSTTAWGMMIRW